MFIDVVTDAMLIAASRRNKERGAEDLQSLRFALYSIGGVCGSLVGSLYTQRFHPRYSFFSMLIFIAPLIALASIVREDIDVDSSETPSHVHGSVLEHIRENCS